MTLIKSSSFHSRHSIIHESSLVVNMQTFVQQASHSDPRATPLDSSQQHSLQALQHLHLLGKPQTGLESRDLEQQLG